MVYVKFRVLHSVCNMHLLVLLGRRESEGLERYGKRQSGGTSTDVITIRIIQSVTGGTCILFIWILYGTAVMW